MVENIVIGEPLIDLWHLLGTDEHDTSWQNKTIYTNERFLPRILKDLELVPSTSWVRKNKPELYAELNKPDFFRVQISKKKPLIWIVVGR